MTRNEGQGEYMPPRKAAKIMVAVNEGSTEPL